ncbi:MAG: hypothetical protein Q9213_006204 [Squamulea squamosa]
MARKAKVVAPAAAARTTGTPIEQHGSTNSAAAVVDGEDTIMDDQHEPRPNGKSSAKLECPVSYGATAVRTDASSDTFDDDSDAGLELLGQGMKAFVTVVQNLRDLGVEELVLPLPKIVVLGDQSTGKSSLIEGISGIKVPRSSGTCTRCPLELNLTPAEAGSPWKATIYLQKRYIYEGPQLQPFGKSAAARGEAATKSRPLGPWIAQGLPENFLFFKTNRKSEIPEALRLAQLATLNPGSDPARYLPGAKGNPGNHQQVKFCPNPIRIDISSPDVPNLSFYDLPGIINQAEVPEEEHLVKLVQNLVKGYVKDEACINLLAIPMTDDAANSTASTLVQELNAQHRTLGVLTKPDRVQSGESMAQWIDILDGKKFKLGHGYYVVKNNPNPEVSNAIARQEEDEFFDQEPWVRTLGLHRDRFGTLKLSTKLSKLLNSQIKTSLPKITEQVRLKTFDIIERLRGLPEPQEGNLSLKIFEKISILERDIARHLDGGSEDYPFQKEFHAAAVRFRNILAFSFPRLVFTSSAPLAYRLSTTPTPSRNRCPDIIPIESDGESEANQKLTQTPTPSKRKQTSTQMSQSTPTKRSRLGMIPQFLPSQDNGVNSFDSSSTGIDRTAPFAKRFTPWDIRTILQDAHIGLPNQVDPRATKRMIRDSLSHWDKPLEELLSFTSQICLTMILERASSVFNSWQGTRCYELLIELCQSFFQEKFKIQATSAKRTLDMERHSALTLHEDAMRTASDEALTALQDSYRNERVKAFLAKQDPEWDNGLKDSAKMKRMSEVTEAQLGGNPFVQELRALADVRGYYECAFSRFVDVVYQGIQTEFLTACRNELGTALKQGVGLEEKDAEQRCAILLAVDPENERIRGELLKQKQNLETASEWLESQ